MNQSQITALGRRLSMNFNRILMIKVENLWHPESPGVKVLVTRGCIGRLFKPRSFATLREVINE